MNGKDYAARYVNKEIANVVPRNGCMVIVGVAHVTKFGDSIVKMDIMRMIFVIAIGFVPLNEN